MSQQPARENKEWEKGLKMEKNEGEKKSLSAAQ